jgi:hypothetical protein
MSRVEAAYAPLYETVGGTMALDTASTTKVCAICHVPKPFGAFHKCTKSADGLQRHCRACGRGMLDAADARRKAAARGPLPIATDWEGLVALFEARAFDVVMALDDAAQAGAEYPFDHLADTLEPDCPTLADDYGGPHATCMISPGTTTSSATARCRPRPCRPPPCGTRCPTLAPSGGTLSFT